MKRSRVFNQVASLYDQFRPGYPEELILYLFDKAYINPCDHVLEIGCGSGQLTFSLAERLNNIIAIDQGLELLKLAREKARNKDGNQSELCFEHSKFEDFKSNHLFDVIISAQAFHWIEPESGLQKVHELLKPEGQLILIWNLDTRSEDTQFWQATEPLYEKYSPVDRSPNTRLGLKAEDYYQYLIQSPLFHQVTHQLFPWQITYSKSHYLNLIGTYSDHYTLPEPEKTQFFSEMAQVIDDFDGEVQRFYDTLLITAKKQ